MADDKSGFRIRLPAMSVHQPSNAPDCVEQNRAATGATRLPLLTLLFWRTSSLRRRHLFFVSPVHR